MRVKDILCLAFLIPLGTALPAWSAGPTVYKCGNSYSDTPCPDGKTIGVDDARDAAQKKQSDEAARRDAVRAHTMESERLAQEKKAMAPTGSKAIVPKAAAAPAPSDRPLTIITPKRLKSPAKKPDFFIAEVPGSEPDKPKKAKKK